ncbi:MAG: hypothetical protein EOO57_13875 [Hymenobacter sp.]|nr:MAG: hypothetical protein EOO57_13875 [Hymenobacter sp.]
MIEFSRVYRFFLLFSLFTACSVSASFAQSKLNTIRLSPEDQERGSHGSQSNFFFLPPGQTGEDNYKSAGFFGQKLRPYIKNSPEAVAELNKYSRQKTLFLIDRGVVLSAVVVYGVQVFAHSGDAQYFNSTQQVAIGAAAVGLIATLFINHRTNDYLKQAVDNYNTDPAAAKHGALWQRLRPAGVGLGATAQGQPTLGLRWQL